MIKVNVNEKLVEVEPGATVMDAAKKAGVDIPTLCHHPKLHPYGACRLCLVEVEGARTLVPSCTAPATDNMVVHTDTPRVKKARNFYYPCSSASVTISACTARQLTAIASYKTLPMLKT